jgi:hypothetical protein
VDKHAQDRRRETMPGSTDTPKGYNVTDLRSKLTDWTSDKSKSMTLNDFIQVDTADCYNRATVTIPNKWGVLQTPLTFTDSASTLVDGATDLLNQKTFKPRLVSLQTPAKWGGADCSIFTGFHYILLIAAGADSDGKKFCVVYDPDVTATAKSKTAWENCKSGADKQKAAAAAVIQKMVLGENNELGALVRYFYAS